VQRQWQQRNSHDLETGSQAAAMEAQEVDVRIDRAAMPQVASASSFDSSPLKSPYVIAALSIPVRTRSKEPAASAPAVRKPSKDPAVKAQAKKLQGPSVVVVTGAASGIGKQLTLELARKGCTIVAVDKNEGALAEIMNDKKIKTCVADIGTQDGVAAVRKAVGSRPVKVIAFVAGLFVGKPLLRMDRNSMKEMMGCHSSAPIFLTQALVPNLSAARGSRILLTTSSGADMHIPTFGGYGATCNAMNTLWLALRDECADFASVALCNPGIVKTPFWDRHLSDPKWIFRPAFGTRFKGRDYHTAEEVAEWMTALLDRSKVDDAAFARHQHIIDNPKHQCGIQISLTTEGKRFSTAR